MVNKMKAILEFNLPEEQAEHKQALQGADWECVLLELDLAIRNKLKHGHKFKNADSALDWVRKQLHEEMQSRNLEFSM